MGRGKGKALTFGLMMGGADIMLLLKVTLPLERATKLDAVSDMYDSLAMGVYYGVGPPGYQIDS